MQRGGTMSEREWLVCTDPWLMLEFVHGKCSDRKLRLLATNACRRMWHLLVDERSRHAVLMAELYADGLATADELLEVRTQALAVFQHLERTPRRLTDFRDPQVDAAEAAVAVTAAAAFAPPGQRVPRWEYFTSAIGADAAALAAERIWLLEEQLIAAEANHLRLTNHQAIRLQREDDAGTLDAGLWKELMEKELSVQPHYFRCVFGPLLFHDVTIDPRCLKWDDGALVEFAQAIYTDSAFDRLPALADMAQEAGLTRPDFLAHCRGAEPHSRGCWVVDVLWGIDL
jgi:hypothetical protein